MNPRAQCFLVAHFNRQEANFKWSGPHSTAVYVKEREREREISTYKVLKTAGKEEMQQAVGRRAERNT